jgi:hypothetical protein
VVKVQNLRLDLPFGEVKVGDKRLPVFLTKSAWAHLNASWLRTGGFTDTIELNGLIALANDAGLTDVASKLEEQQQRIATLQASVDVARVADLEEDVRGLRQIVDALRGFMDVATGGALSRDNLGLTAAEIANVPAGDIAGTNLQTVVNELDTEKQPRDADLTAIAGLTPTDDDLIQRKAGAWTNRTLAQVKTDLALNNVDNTSDVDKPISDDTQDALDLKAPLNDPLLTGTVQLGGSNFNALLSGGNPNIAVDTNDYIAYDRTSNAYGFYIGSTLECQITSTGVTADGFFVDANCSLAFVSSNPTLAFDTNDYLVYDRTGNTASLYINSVLCAKFTESSLTAGPEFFGRVQFGDNQFYARLNTNPFLTFDSSDYISYDRTSNIMGFYIGGTAELLIDANGLTVNSATMIKTTTAFTNGAGAGAGTLSNAPAAGNPTKWIPVDDNGTTRYIPAW